MLSARKSIENELIIFLKKKGCTVLKKKQFDKKKLIILHFKRIIER